MKRVRTFPERLETIMILALAAGILLIAQRYSLMLYKVGLSVLVTATLLQIAVGNLRKDASVGRSLAFILMVLAIIVVVFAIGIFLVPYFAQLGR
jgi:predicted PurR-regulated permease PerM